MSWRRFFQRAKWDDVRREELESYIQLETDDNIARGMSPDDARAAAQRKLGNATLIREEIYTMNTIGFLESLGRDLRQALRMLRRNAVFTVTALLTLAIGIGATTAIFSVVNGVLLKPLPYANADRLAGIWLTAPGAGFKEMVLSASAYFTFREHNRTLDDIGIYTGGSETVTGNGAPLQVDSTYVTEGVLPILGVRPVRGRGFTRADVEPKAPETVMLTYGYWQSRFGGADNAVGQKLVLNGRPVEVIGILPESFTFSNRSAQLVLPLWFDRSRLHLASFSYRGIGRIKPGVTIDQVNSDIARMLPIYLRSWPPPPGMSAKVFDDARMGPNSRPYKQDVVGDLDTVLWVLMATVGIVLLIACANVANLLLVRADGRQQELAVRAALGASWRRIARELLIESVTLGIIGGALGIGVAYGAIRLLLHLAPAHLPRLDEIALDPSVLVFAFAISILAGVLFGLIPVFKYARPRIGLALRAGGRTSSDGRERHMARSSLVVVQVALALVLLVGSGLMIRTMLALLNVDPGFTRPHEILTLRLSIPYAQVKEPERTARMHNDIIDRISKIGGVQSVSATSSVPIDGLDSNNPVYVEGRVSSDAQLPPMRRYKHVAPGYFKAMGNRIVAGRDFTWADTHEMRNVAIISENMAREYWPNPSGALGKRIRENTNSNSWREIVGVAADERDAGISQEAPSIVFWPYLLADFWGDKVRIERGLTYVIRTPRAGSQDFIRQVQEAVWSVNSNLPVAGVRTMQEIYDRSLARSSFTLVMLSIASGMALLLGIIGIYGVISYAVSKRRREIGIRLALGAQQGELKRMFVRHALLLVGIGVAIGLGGALAVSRLMKSLLFEISPEDPFTFTVVPVILIAAAALASYLPARRVAAVDPAETLRSE